MRCDRSVRGGVVGSVAAKGRPRSTGWASSKTMGASGSGNSSVPRTGTGGTTTSVGGSTGADTPTGPTGPAGPERPPGTTRTGRTVGGPIRSDRCSRVPRAWL